jgi:hypothetical protein
MDLLRRMKKKARSQQHYQQLSILTTFPTD